MGINVCIPTLTRYDLLKFSIDRLQHGTMLPDSINIIDNGGSFFDNGEKSLHFTDTFGIHHHYVKFDDNIGCAKSWNWFCENVPSPRIIMNDDLMVMEDTLELMFRYADPVAVTFPGGISATNVFSCFMIPDHVYRTVGGFDEDLSPDYCYYEDNDFNRRLLKVGLEVKAVKDCNIEHFGSATLRSFTPGQLEEHNKRFELASNNYIQKWGGLPGHETL